MCETEINDNAKKAYGAVHEALEAINEAEPVFVDEFLRDNRQRRYDFISNIVTPCKSLLFTRSGTGGQNLHFLWQVSHQKTESDLVNEAHSIVKKMEKELPVFHSRAMKQDFIQSFRRATGCKSAFLCAAYQRLTGNSSAAFTTTEAEVDERASRILDEEDQI